MSLVHFILRNRAAVDNTYKRHVERVFNRGGFIYDEYQTKGVFDFLLRRNLSEYALVAGGHLGYKYGATNGQISEYYSIHPESDLIQSTAAAQPVLHEWRGENYWIAGSVFGNHVLSQSSVNYSKFTALIKLKQVQGGYPHGNVIGKVNGLSIALINNQVNVTTTDDIATRVGFSGYSLTPDIDHLIRVVVDMSIETPTVTVSITNATTGAVLLTPTTKNLVGTPVTTGNWIVGGTIAQLGQYRAPVYFAKIYNGVEGQGGTLAVNFDANDYRKTDPTDQAGWNASLTNERWTINTDANATGIKGVLVDHTMMQTDGIQHNLKTGVMALNQPVSMYLPVNVLNAVNSYRRIYDNLSGTAFAARLNNTGTALEVITDNSYLPPLALSGLYKKWVLLSTCHNGLNSYAKFNGQGVIGDAGVAGTNGFTFGSNRSNLEHINALYCDFFVTKVSDTPSQQADMNAFLNSINKRYY